ncbi:5-methylthioadenosine/S-adenosylhomocysteine deaminase [Poseidonocella pacifica]|uniref:5-methylthioadenosine/S-adenosylhomocysteine deaminase n=1 Tax=Poseidonocella pacifica TaxID=871651 RepID=A0A1I0VC61_9RHOB|nr:amidohydrolase family protein [Poseidonocella pacifica]SFA73954.1 5-methylthioadenosine/S-adenosylhomocysteine deaminase [Poseidonocella pacifica]
MASHLRNITLLSCGIRLQRSVDLLVDDDGRIAEIGADLPARNGVEVVDARGALCLPGFVNSHNHSPLMVVRGMVEDKGFAPAYIPNVPQGHWLSEEETLALARLGVLEMLLAGATTIVDYYRYPEALARAADELGLRALVGGRVMDMDTAALSEGRFERNSSLGDSTLRAALDVIETWEGHDRISTILAPHAPDSCSREMFTEFRALAEQTGKQVHTHLSQSQMEVDQIVAREGMTPTEFLDDLGLLSPDLIAAHCIFMSESDISRFGAAGGIVAHAPIGNASFGAAAPIKALRDAGATITLCTDTKSADMFEAMRMAIAAARWKAGMSFDLNAEEVFGWATCAGADALKGHGATGRLEIGDPADLILLDPLAPNLCPVIDGFGIVAHSGSAANVTDVMVQGKWLVRDRAPTLVDARDIICEAQKVSERLWDRAANT